MCPGVISVDSGSHYDSCETKQFCSLSRLTDAHYLGSILFLSLFRFVACCAIWKRFG